MNIIAIDPGTISGYAILKRTHTISVVEYGMLDFKKSEDVTSLESVVNKTDISKAIIEDQFYATQAWQKKIMGHVKQSSIQKLTRYAGWWEYAFIKAGINDVEWIQPIVWQKAMMKGLPKSNSKERSLFLVKEFFDIQLKKKEHHIADAILIGVYLLQKSKGGQL